MKILFQGAAIETRTETLMRFVNLLLHETRTSRETFAQNVVEAYHQQVPAAARTVEFRTEGDPFACAKTNTQRLFRMLDPEFEESRLAVDLEEALVQALPDQYQADCVRALARRYGLLDVRVPTATTEGSIQSIGQFVEHFGSTIMHLSPVLADGKIDQQDAALIPQALRDLEELNANVIGLIASLRAAGQGG